MAFLMVSCRGGFFSLYVHENSRTVLFGIIGANEKGKKRNQGRCESDLRDDDSQNKYVWWWFGGLSFLFSQKKWRGKKEREASFFFRNEWGEKGVPFFPSLFFETGFAF